MSTDQVAKQAIDENSTPAHPPGRETPPQPAPPHLPSHLEDPGQVVFGPAGLARLDNFPGDRLDAFRLRQLCSGSAVIDGREMIGQTVRVRYWLAQPVEVQREDGEIDTWVRCVLITPAGQAIAFSSTGVARTIQDLYATFGRADLGSDGMPFRIVSKSTNNKRTMYLLEPVAEDSK